MKFSNKNCSNVCHLLITLHMYNRGIIPTLCYKLLVGLQLSIVPGNTCDMEKCPVAAMQRERESPNRKSAPLNRMLTC